MLDFFTLLRRADCAERLGDTALARQGLMSVRDKYAERLASPVVEGDGSPGRVGGYAKHYLEAVKRLEVLAVRDSEGNAVAKP